MTLKFDENKVRGRKMTRQEIEIPRGQRFFCHSELAAEAAVEIAHFDSESAKKILMKRKNQRTFQEIRKDRKDDFPDRAKIFIA